MQTGTRKLVSIPDTCTELGGVSRTTIYDLVNSGLLVRAHIGSRAFITAGSLDAYIESLTPATTPPDPVQAAAPSDPVQRD